MAEIQEFLSPKAEAQIDKLLSSLSMAETLYGGLGKSINSATKQYEKELAKAMALNKEYEKGEVDRKRLVAMQKETLKVSKNLVAVDAKLEASTTKQAEALARKRAKLSENNKELRNNVKQQLEVEKRTKEGVKNAQQITGAYDRLSKELRDQRKLAKDLAVTYGEGSEEYKTAAARVNELDKRLKSVDGALGQNQRNVGNYAQSIKQAYGEITKLKNENKNLRKELKNVDRSTEQGRKRYKQIQQQIKANSKQTKIYRGSILSLGGTFKNTAASAQQLPGTLGQSANGLARFGQAAKALISNPLVAVIAAVAGAFLLLRKAMTRSEEGQNRLNKAWRISSSVVNNVLDILTSLGIALFDTFPKNLKRTGNGFRLFFNDLLLGVKSAQKAWFEFTGQSERANAMQMEIEATKDRMVELREENQQLTVEIDKAFGEVGKQISNIGNEIREDIDAAGELADLEAAFNRTERRVLTQNAELRKQAAADFAESEELKKSSAEASIDALNRAFDTEERINQNNLQLARARLDLLRRESALSSDNIEAKRAIAQAEAEVIQIEGEFDNIRRQRARRLNFLRLEAFRQQQNQAKAEIELLKTTSAARLRELEKRSNDENLGDDDRIDALNSLALAELQVIEKNGELELASLENQKALKLLNDQDYAQQKELLEQQIADEVLQVNERLSDDIDTIRSSRIEKEKQAAAEIVAARAAAEAQDLTANLQRQESQLALQRAKGLIDEEDYQQSLFELRTGAVQDQITQAEQALSAFEGSEVEKLNLLTDLSGKRQELYKLENDFAIAQAANQAKEVERIQKRVRDTAIFVADQTAKVLSTINERDRERKQAELDAELESEKIAADNRIAEAQRRLDAGIITEQQFAEKKAAIEQQLADKEKAIRLQKFKADRSAALTQVAIDTAAGIVKTIAQNGFLAALPLIPAIVATGAVQAAIIATQPIPKFATGTQSSPEGLALVGEAGREILNYPDGTSAIAEAPTITHLPRGTEVLNNRDTERMIASGYHKSDNNDLVREIQSLKKVIKNKREYHFNFKKGTVSTRESGRIKNYYNRKVS